MRIDELSQPYGWACLRVCVTFQPTSCVYSWGPAAAHTRPGLCEVRRDGVGSLWDGQRAAPEDWHHATPLSVSLISHLFDVAAYIKALMQKTAWHLPAESSWPRQIVKKWTSQEHDTFWSCACTLVCVWVWVWALSVPLTFCFLCCQTCGIFKAMGRDVKWADFLECWDGSDILPWRLVSLSFSLSSFAFAVPLWLPSNPEIRHQRTGMTISALLQWDRIRLERERERGSERGHGSRTHPPFPITMVRSSGY